MHNEKISNLIYLTHEIWILIQMSPFDFILNLLKAYSNLRKASRSLSALITDLKHSFRHVYSFCFYSFELSSDCL